VLRKELFLPVTGPSPGLRVHDHVLRHRTLHIRTVDQSPRTAPHAAIPEGTIRD
jgi:hypothetical protein